jgi:hypothetical protein
MGWGMVGGMSTTTTTTKKTARPLAHRGKKRKFSKYAFGPAALEACGMISSGVGNLSSLEGYDIFR